MSGAYLRIGRAQLGIWRWWLENSAGEVIHSNSYGYRTAYGAREAARRSGWRFFG